MPGLRHRRPLARELPARLPPAPEAVRRGERWLITVLTEGLIRLEWADAGAFEDRASTFALHRDLPVAEFDVDDGQAALEVVARRCG